MAKKYAAPVGKILLDGLKKGRSLLKLLWGTTKFDGPSRLAVYMDTISYRSGKARPRLATLADELNATIPEVRKWLNAVSKKGWFAQGKDGFWYPLYKGRQELREKLQADVATRWIISDITEKSVKVDGKIQYVYRDLPAPHGNHGNKARDVGFEEETGRSQPTITRCLDGAEADGFTVRFKRQHKGEKTLYVRPDNTDLIWKLERQYDLADDTPRPRVNVVVKETSTEQQLRRQEQVAWEQGVDSDGMPLGPIVPAGERR